MMRSFGIRAAALVLIAAWGAAGCGKTVEQLAKGKGELAADAKAVLAALAKVKNKPKKVPAYKKRRDAGNYTSGTEPRAAVVVQGDRIVEFHLRCVGEGIDLAPLKKATKLRHLIIQASGLKSLPPVEGLPALQVIDARFNQIASVTKVRNLPRLETLDLTDNPLTTLEGLEDLPALTTINFTPKALTTVRNWKNVGVTSLDFSGSKLTTLAGLTKLDKLKRLAASKSKIVALELSKMPALASLVVKSTLLARLVVKDMPKLTVLNAIGNRLTDGSVVLSALPKLTHLGLGKNKLTVVPKVSGGLPKLAWFDLSNNKITSLAGLEALNPKEFFVDHNQLTNLALATAPAETPKRKEKKGKTPAPAGATVPKLITLRADHNQLSSLDGIAAYPALVYLYLGNNKLTSLAGIEQAKKLKKVRVEHNQLTTLKPLATAQLTELIATDNKLADRKELFGPTGNKRPKIARYDVRRNAWVGVAATMLFFGLATPSYHGTYKPPRRRTHGGGYRGSRGYRSSRRYSGGGGYRSGK